MVRFFTSPRHAAASAPEPQPAARAAPAGGQVTSHGEGVSQADHAAAVAAARAEGEQAATARLSAILTAEGIRGSMNRTNTAIDLASKSPGMSAEDVIAFVKLNTPAVPAAALANRTQADPLAVIGGSFLPPTSADGWGEAISKAAGKVEPK